MKKILAIAFVALLTAGCRHYPMGMDEKSWKALPPEKKAELLKEQARLDHERQLAALKTREAEARAQAEIEKARQESLRALYRRLRYGELLQLGFLGGAGYFYGYAPIVEDSFMLTAGSVERLRLLSRRGDTLEVWAAYTPGKLLLCSEKPDAPDRFDPRACAVLVDRRWDDGEERTVTVPRPWSKKPLLRQVRVFIRYAPLKSDRHDHWR